MPLECRVTLGDIGGVFGHLCVPNLHYSSINITVIIFQMKKFDCLIFGVRHTNPPVLLDHTTRLHRHYIPIPYQAVNAFRSSCEFVCWCRQCIDCLFVLSSPTLYSLTIVFAIIDFVTLHNPNCSFLCLLLFIHLSQIVICHHSISSVVLLPIPTFSPC